MEHGNRRKSGFVDNGLTKWLAIFGAWMAAAAIFTSQFYAQGRLARNPVPLWRAFCLQAVSAGGWFLMSPLVLWVGRRFPLRRGSLSKSLPVHIIFGALVVVALQALDAFVVPKLGYPSNAAEKTYLQLYREFLLLNFHVNYLIYWMVVGLQNLVGFVRESRERELRAAQLETQLAEARLQALKNQLHPHFFFNTLNAISALIYNSPKEADRIITKLGDLMRVSLKKDEAEEVTLREDIEFLRAFLQIHQTLMGKRLRIEWRIEPDTLDALVPNLILQPLAENAIRHGLSPLEEGGRITICASRKNGSLLLGMSDNGRGIDSNIKNKEGIGLTNTRARLETLYRGEYDFSIHEASGGGVSVSIEIPFREKTA